MAREASPHGPRVKATPKSSEGTHTVTMGFMDDEQTSARLSFYEQQGYTIEKGKFNWRLTCSTEAFEARQQEYRDKALRGVRSTAKEKEQYDIDSDLNGRTISRIEVSDEPITAAEFLSNT